MTLVLSTSPAAYAVPPVERAFKLLRHIAGGDSVANISETARTVGISRTTLIRLMATLEAEQMIERRSDGTGFKLGLGLAGLAGQALFASDIIRVGDPTIRQLGELLGLSSHIGVLSGRDVLYVARHAPNMHLVSNVGIGSRLPAHATTLGRIILAFMPRNAVVGIFQGARLKASTAKTPTTLVSLLRQLDIDRAAEIAWSESHFEVGISSAAAAVFDRTGTVIGAINVTGPTASFGTDARRLAEIEQEVRTAALLVSRQLGFVPVEKMKQTRSSR